MTERAGGVTARDFGALQLELGAPVFVTADPKHLYLFDGALQHTPWEISA